MKITNSYTIELFSNVEESYLAMLKNRLTLRGIVNELICSHSRGISTKFKSLCDLVPFFGTKNGMPDEIAVSRCYTADILRSRPQPRYARKVELD